MRQCECHFQTWLACFLSEMATARFGEEHAFPSEVWLSPDGRDEPPFRVGAMPPARMARFFVTFALLARLSRFRASSIPRGSSRSKQIASWNRRSRRPDGCEDPAFGQPLGTRGARMFQIASAP